MPEIADSLNAREYKEPQPEADRGVVIAHALRADGFDASEDGTGRGTPIVPCYGIDEEQNTHVDVMGCLKAREKGGGFEGSVAVPIAFSAKDHGADAMEDCSPTLRSCGEYGVNGGPMPAVAIQSVNMVRERKQNGIGISEEDVMYSLTERDQHAVAFQSSQSGVRQVESHATLDSHNGSRRHNGVMQGMAVRRLTPRECERLMGFPDDYTLIPYRGKPAADGNRYKALGNSMAVPVMAWLGRRIQMVEDIMHKKEEEERNGYQCVGSR